MLAAESIEPDNATKEDGHVVIALCRHRAFVSQLIGNRWWQDRIEQSEKEKRNEHSEREHGGAGDAGLKSVLWINILFAQTPPFGHFAVEAAFRKEGGVSMVTG